MSSPYGKKAKYFMGWYLFIANNVTFLTHIKTSDITDHSLPTTAQTTAYQ